MPISVVCPHCASKLNAPEKMAGRKTKCPKCRTELILSRPDEEVTVDSEAPLAVVQPCPREGRSGRKFNRTALLIAAVVGIACAGVVVRRILSSGGGSPFEAIFDPEANNYRKKLSAAVDESKSLANILRSYPTRETAKARALASRPVFAAVTEPPSGAFLKYSEAWLKVGKMEMAADSAERAADRWMQDRLDFANIDRAHKEFLALAKTLDEAADAVSAILKK